MPHQIFRQNTKLWPMPSKLCSCWNSAQHWWERIFKAIWPRASIHLKTSFIGHEIQLVSLASPLELLVHTLQLTRLLNYNCFLVDYYMSGQHWAWPSGSIVLSPLSSACCPKPERWPSRTGEQTWIALTGIGPQVSARVVELKFSMVRTRFYFQSIEDQYFSIK